MPYFTRSGFPVAWLFLSFFFSSSRVSICAVPRKITASCSSTGLKLDIEDSREELEAADGLEGMRDMLDGRFAGVFRPAQHKHVVAHRDLAQEPSAGQEAGGRVGDLLLLAQIDRGRGLLDRVGPVARRGAHFDDHERF